LGELQEAVDEAMDQVRRASEKAAEALQEAEKAAIALKEANVVREPRRASLLDPIQ
jgi:hypothetical protein